MCCVTFLEGFSQVCHLNMQIIEEGCWWYSKLGHCSLLVTLELPWQQETFKGVKGLGWQSVRSKA